MRGVMLSCVACVTLPSFSTLYLKRKVLLKNVIEQKLCILMFSITFVETFLILNRIQRDVIINVHKYSCVPVIFNRFF